MMKRILTALLLGAVCGAYAQPAVLRPSEGRAPARSQFISYDTRPVAEGGVREKSAWFIPLAQKFTRAADGTFAAQLDLPASWEDREVFLHVEGIYPGYKLTVNGSLAGYTSDSRTPAEFNLSSLMHEGANSVVIAPDESTPGARLEPAGKPSVAVGDVYLYSQPRTRIEDFRMSGYDSFLKLDIALANSFNYDEKIAVGYDIYSPDGKLQYYDKREITLPGNGRDTIRFNEYIRGAGAGVWSPAKPGLYRVMMIVWYRGRIVEYVPFKLGFTAPDAYAANLAGVKAAVAAGKVSLYSASSSQVKAKGEIAGMKKMGVAVLRTPYPQPEWFYGICDELGMRVIDQTNINAPEKRLDTGVGGTPVNDPAMRDFVLEREESMFARVRNHVCISAWSPAAMSGNGYNMYLAYRWLKAADPTRPVIYDDAQGEWNSDL